MILITRSQEAAEKTAQQLKEKGFESLISPVMTIKSRPCDMKKVPDVALFTSVNGVRHCPKDLISLVETAMTVGDATAYEAEKTGFKRVISAQGGVDALYDLIVKSYPERDVSLGYFCATHLTGDLHGRLKGVGFYVDPYVVYEAQAGGDLSDSTWNALSERVVTTALFFSARTARIFMDIVRARDKKADLKGVQALCISHNVADALEADSWLRIDVAHSPTTEAMIESLCEKEME